MGFYGNITNTNKTQFTFDRSYSSRALMDQRIDRDGIYLGRYVLVEYSLDTSKDMYYLAFKKGDKFYAAANFDSRTELKYTDNPYAITTKVTNENNSTVYVTTGQVIRTREDITNDGVTDDILSDVFYRCTGGDENGIALFEQLVASNDSYTANYGIDKALYKTENYNQGRGYDSTVWQKVYVGEDEKYVMIAELNTVTPTFELSVDAPTMEPITPHFGTDSTNLNYKLHWQPQWGLRVAAESNPNKSDAKINHIKYTYDAETDKITEEITNLDGAIYFNKKGFLKGSRSIDGDLDSGTAFNNNYLKIAPAKSGLLYNAHDGKKNTLIKKDDVYEMSVHLPTLGNLAAILWDTLIGKNRNENNLNPDNITGLKNILNNEILTIKALNGAGFENSIIMTNSSGALTGGLLNGGTKKIISNILDEKIYESNNSNIFAQDAWIYADFNDDTGETVIVKTPKRDENTGEIIIDETTGEAIMEEHEVPKGGITLYHNFTPFGSSVSKVEGGNYTLEITEKPGSIPNDSSGIQYFYNKLATSNLDYLTGEGNIKLNFYVPYVDKTGHIVGHNVETFVLPHLSQQMKSDEKWIHQEVGNKKILEISHIQRDIESVVYGDDVESFYVLSNKNIEESNDNHIISVIKVQKDDFSLYWKGITD